MKKELIMLVEDDPSIRLLVTENLKNEGYIIKSSDDIESAKKQISTCMPDLVILDRRLPDGDGLNFCREIRISERTKHIPVLFLTALGGIYDKISGFKIGGDDYLTKPFDVKELIVRVESIIRRRKAVSVADEKVLKAKNIVLNTETHECYVNNKMVNLWPKEYELLKMFIEKKGKVLNKEYISENIWNREYYASSRTMEMTIGRLRKKLGKFGNVIETVKGYGFKMKA
ncbi:MAG: hypothetical protein A2252_03765 [Elusimicrobia bacterium RIFOXYA2_FULL_39_19]|nr:MAG: hypothetical protein A2252_03765 [Elusimicrobia bacterium RIFOXYA2_FULL_39_19]